MQRREIARKLGKAGDEGEEAEKLPEELIEFSEKFRKNNNACFIAWTSNLKPCIAIADNFTFEKDRIVLECRSLKIENQARAAFITENEHYADKCEFIYVNGILTEHGKELCIFPEKAIWSIAFDINKFPRFPERIMKKWHSRKQASKQNNSCRAHRGVIYESEACEEGSFEEAEKLFREITTPVIFASVDKSGASAHATPMNWLWLSNEKLFWFNPAGKTKKIENLRASKSICFATLENAKKHARGFIVHGEIVKWDEGIGGFLRNMLLKRRMLVEKSGVYINAKTMKFWLIYALHRDIYYSTLPWNAAFLRVKPQKIIYWSDKNTKKEILIE